MAAVRELGVLPVGLAILIRRPDLLDVCPRLVLDSLELVPLLSEQRVNLRGEPLALGAEMGVDLERDGMERRMGRTEGGGEEEGFPQRREEGD